MTKKKELPKELLSNVYERPEYLDKLTQRGDFSRMIMKLSAQIKGIPNNSCVKYTIDEFVNQFGITGTFDTKKMLTKIKVYLRNIGGIKRPRVVFDDGKIIIWETRQ